MPKKPQPKREEQSSAQVLLEALKEAEAQHKKSERDKRRKPRFKWLAQMPGHLRVGMLVLLVVFVVLVGDGLRREGLEFNAVLHGFSGSVMVTDKDKKNILPKPPMDLRDGYVVTTGERSTATIAFTDGSAIQVQEKTQFEVRLMDYARGGTRDRSFMVRYGSAVANVSRFFGQKSRATICTPTTVAAVRGTGFQVYFDPQSRRSLVGVTEGRVNFRTPSGATTDLQAGALGGAVGYRGQLPQQLLPNAQTRIGGDVQQLSQQYEKEPDLLTRVEMALNNALDPVLQVLGLAPGGWSYQAVSFARYGAAKKVMTDLARHIEAMPGDQAPEFLNPITLDELNLQPQERQRILDQLAGNMLESYQRTGINTYTIRARARDKKRTLFELTATGITEIKE